MLPVYIYELGALNKPSAVGALLALGGWGTGAPYACACKYMGSQLGSDSTALDKQQTHCNSLANMLDTPAIENTYAVGPYQCCMRIWSPTCT